MFGICPIDEDLKFLYTVDGLHPNDLGYKRIFELLRERIDAIWDMRHTVQRQ